MLTLGEEVPSFRLPGVQRGKIKDFRLTDYRGNGLILFFYPEDFSFICPTEVMGFQRLYSQYRTQDYEALGISTDGVETHRTWAEELGGIDWKSGLEVFLIATAAALAGYGFGLLSPEH